MKKILYTALMCLICHFSATAQETNRYANLPSLNLLVGISYNEPCFTFSPLCNIVLNDASGVQFAGISNHIKNDGKGFEFAGLVNTASQFKGVQFAGFTNIADNITGLQFAGLSNTASKNIRGVQFAGIVNTAGDVTGVQFAGFVNIAQKVHGVQFATLVNVAEECDCPIGIINIIRNGEKGIALTYDINGTGILSFRSGSKYTYGIIGVGINHKADSDNKIAFEAGYGAHIPVLDWFRIDNELKATTIGSAEKSINNFSYSLLPSFIIGGHYNIFAGVSLNYLIAQGTPCLVPSSLLWVKNHNNWHQELYIGGQIGVQYIF